MNNSIDNACTPTGTHLFHCFRVFLALSLAGLSSSSARAQCPSAIWQAIVFGLIIGATIKFSTIKAKFLGASLLAFVGCILGSSSCFAGTLTIAVQSGGPVLIGERLILETRFAELFFPNCGGNANIQLTNGDPLMDFTVSPIYGNLPGPFAGQFMNCRACHLVEEEESTGNRIYCDFVARSPVPNIGDGQTYTDRNAMTFVDSLLPRQVAQFLHFDGQLTDPIDLIITALTGRNYGWQPTEYSNAIHHIANIIRNDNGTGCLDQQYGGSS
jgi:hypothetical protein